jgi:signal transduction histidine kinase
MNLNASGLGSDALRSVAERTRRRDEDCLDLLVVEDDPNEAFLLAHALRREFRVRLVPRLADARVRLGSERYDAVLLDLSVCDARGESTFQQILDTAASTPVVVLTAAADEEFAIDAVRSGVQDCIVKGETDPAAIGRAVRHAVERFRAITHLDLVHRRQLEAKQRVLDHVSHELRSPLHLARLGISMALDVDGVAPECRDELMLAGSQLDHVVHMIRDLLETARIDNDVIVVDPLPVDPTDVVKEVVAAGQAELVLAPELPAALADPDRLRQVLTNLIDNALKFTGAGTTVTVSVSPSARSPALLEFAVADEGPGIDPGCAERLFDRFHQEASSHVRSGLGLGLFICRELVHRQGGEIWVENARTRGARFAFTLPASSPTH